MCCTANKGWSAHPSHYIRLRLHQLTLGRAHAHAPHVHDGASCRCSRCMGRAKDGRPSSNLSAAPSSILSSESTCWPTSNTLCSLATEHSSSIRSRPLSPLLRRCLFVVGRVISMSLRIKDGHTSGHLTSARRHRSQASQTTTPLRSRFLSGMIPARGSSSSRRMVIITRRRASAQSTAASQATTPS
jgi:hypothetical protein